MRTPIYAAACIGGYWKRENGMRAVATSTFCKAGWRSCCANPLNAENFYFALSAQTEAVKVSLFVLKLAPEGWSG